MACELPDNLLPEVCLIRLRRCSPSIDRQAWHGEVLCQIVHHIHSLGDIKVTMGKRKVTTVEKEGVKGYGERKDSQTKKNAEKRIALW